jgi:hypothetical protein
MNNSRVAILSVPWCEPRPLVAPVLLAACLQSHGIFAKGVDFAYLFWQKFHDKSYFAELKNFLCMAHTFTPNFDRQVLGEVLLFSKKFLDVLIDKHNLTHIGLSIFTHESLDFGLLISYLLRKYHPNIQVIAGGKGLELQQGTSWLYNLWIDNGIADTVIIGDAEISIVNAIKQNQTGLVKSQPQTKEDMDSIPLAQWQDYDLTQYHSEHTNLDHNKDDPYLAITASKGCVRKCTFCDVAAFWPTYIFRDPKKVAQEMVYNYKSTGIKLFHFTDNLINGSISNFRSMNQTLVAELPPRTLKYLGFAIFRGKHQMPEEDFALAAEAGNILWGVGVESGSEKVRYDMKKKFDNDDLDWSVRMCYKYGIEQTWLLMVGYPTETEEDFLETKKMISRYAHMRSKISLQVNPPFMLNSNTPLLHDQDLAHDLGLSHNNDTVNFGNRFWTSSKFIDNDYPTRSRRWKELMAHIENEQFRFGMGQRIEKWRQEIDNLDKIYHEQHTKIISIRPV